MELELVVGTIRKGIKSTIYMHILIFIISFQEKVKNYFLFSVIFCINSHVLPKNPKRPNGQSANMAHFVAFFISFQKIIPSKIPPGGEQGLLVAQGLYGLWLHLVSWISKVHHLWFWPYIKELWKSYITALYILKSDVVKTVKVTYFWFCTEIVLSLGVN